jgi:peptidoglycan/LPS O-acetylase OafA/YrhL
MSKASSTANSAAQPTAPRGGRLPYLPGLDGLRALAVIAVLLYHAELRWIPGGFLGVEVFFVISGYLITSLLLSEWDAHGQIDLKAFWLRRARRLLPALFLVIAAVLAFAVLFLHDEVAGLRSDAAAAIGYVTNWYLIFSQQSYFESVGRPSLLRHLWSLAVEEQFYLVWPLLFAVGMRFLRRRLMLPLMMIGIAASSFLMAALYLPDADPSRIYYGTDTRAAGLLTGAALALVWAPWQFRSRASRGKALLLDLIGLGGLAAMIGAFLWLDEFQPFLYQGGFVLVGLATIMVIAAVVHPQAHLSSALFGRRLLRWIGMRSYGIYLWHWPVFMVTRPQLDVAMDEGLLLILRIVATLALAELSYTFVETPIRTGVLGRAWRTWRTTRGLPRWQIGARWAGAMSVAVAFSALGVSVVEAQPPPPPAYLSVEAVNTVDTATEPAPAAPADDPASPMKLSLMIPAVMAQSPATAAESLPEAQAPPAAASASSVVHGVSDRPARPATDAERLIAMGEALPSSTPTPPPIELPPESPRSPTPIVTAETPLQVMAIGDSVMIGAVKELEQAISNVEVDARIGRQVSTLIQILKNRRAAGQLGDVVIIHVGNNGTFSARQFDEIMKVLADVHRVVFVNVRVTHRWEEPNNTVLAEGVKRYPNAVLVDWHAASAARPELFWSDGIHLRPEGARFYADLIAAAARAP